MTPTRGRLVRSVMVAAVMVAACSKAPSAPTSGNETGSPSGRVVAIHGVVQDLLASGNGAPVPGARVDVIYKSAPGPSATSATDGSYRVDGVLAGEFFQIRAGKDTYESTTRFISPVSTESIFDLFLKPIPLSVTGLVTETPPTAETPVPGATLEIVSGSNKGRTTTSDRSGAFTLQDVWGEFDLSVSGADYDTTVVHVSAGTVPRVEVRLPPRERAIHTTLTGGLCTTVRLPSYLSCTQPFERTHTVPVHRAGTMTVSANYSYVGDYYPNSLDLEVRCGSVVVLQRQFRRIWDLSPPTHSPDGGTGPINVALTQPCNYDVRLSNFIADTKGGHQTVYRIDLDHPK